MVSDQESTRAQQKQNSTQHKSRKKMKVKTKNMQTRKAAKITRRKVANFSTVEGQQQGVRIEGMRKTVRKLILSLRKQHKERKQYEERSEAAINRLTANTDQHLIIKVSNSRLQSAARRH